MPDDFLFLFQIWGCELTFSWSLSVGIYVTRFEGVSLRASVSASGKDASGV